VLTAPGDAESVNARQSGPRPVERKEAGYPQLPDERIKTADDIYIRFHGTKQWYRHGYTKAELGLWARRINECGAKTV
jgi:uncharacterized protein YecE (DUF72 family)